MSERYVNVDRQTRLLLPPDLQDWVAQDDLVHFVLEVVESTPLPQVRVRTHGGGSLGYPPSLMLALLIYSYAHGVFSSRQIERSTYQHLSVRYLCANLHPDHDTICTFRRQNRVLLKAVFAQVLTLAGTLGVLRVGTICLDGTKLLANAAKRRTLDLEQIAAQEQRLALEIEARLAQAETSDEAAEGGPDQLPGELVGRTQLKERLSQARAWLEEAAAERAQKQRAERENWQAHPVGDPPQVEAAQVRASDKVNLSDPQSALMPLKSGQYGVGYNAQIATSGQARGLIVAVQVCAQTNDRQQLLEMAQRIKSAVPRARRVVVDRGYDHPRHIEQVEAQLGLKVYCPMQKSPSRPAQGVARASRARIRSQQVRQRMESRAQSRRGRRLMRLRSTTVEPTIGYIKSVLGFRRLSLRGLEAVNTEWELVALAFNVRRLAALRPRN